MADRADRWLPAGLVSVTKPTVNEQKPDINATVNVSIDDSYLECTRVHETWAHVQHTGTEETMRTVSITEIRQDATRLIDEAERTHEPLLVVQRSRPAAYVVPASDYEAAERELRELRHRVFWQDVDEASAEHKRGEGVVYDDVDARIRDMGLEEEPAPKRPARRRRVSPAQPVTTASNGTAKPAGRARARERAAV